MAIKAGDYVYVKSGQRARWRHAKGEPEGVDEVLLHKHEDGSYTHILRVKEGVEFSDPCPARVLRGGILSRGRDGQHEDQEEIGAGAYVFHEPGEEHGPFKCLKTCMVLEFRYYR